MASHGPQMANGGKCTVASHGAQMANGGIATMAGEHAARIQSLGGTATMAGEHAARIQSAGGTAAMAGEHAPRIQSAGGKAGGKARRGRKRGIYKKRNQTAAQAAHAAKMRRYRAANRAVGAH